MKPKKPVKPKKRSLKQRLTSVKRGFVAGTIIGATAWAGGRIGASKLADRMGLPPLNPPAKRAPQNVGPAKSRPKNQKAFREQLAVQKRRALNVSPITGFPKASARMSVVLPKNAKCVSAKEIDSELRRWCSPATGLGSAFEKWGRHYGIRPAVALAFFRMESNFGARGIARKTKAIGNIRYTKTSGSGIEYENYNGFRKYASWEDGIKDFYWLLSSKNYAGGERKALGEIIPVYAPAFENNTERYTRIVVDYLNELYKNTN